MRQRLQSRFVGRRKQALVRGVVLAAAIQSGASAEAATLQQVRVGQHPGFTRVVLELDAPAGYRLEGPEAGPMPRLRIELGAESRPRAVTSRSNLVRSVRVAPRAEGTEVVVALRSAAVRVTETILPEPPRIVLDLHTLGATKPAQPEGRAATETETPRPEAPLAAVAAKPQPSEKQESIEQQVPAPSPAPLARPAREKPLAPSQTHPKPPAVRRPPPPRQAAAPPAPAPAPPRAVAETLRQHVGLVLIAVGVTVLGAVWLGLRRRARRPVALAEDLDSEPPASEEGSEAVAAPPEQAAADSAPVPVPTVQGAAEGLSERLARLESHVERLLESRDRLERQLAAHTEELRVQRAAIARTQRVVRSLARGEPGAPSPGAGASNPRSA